MTEQHRCSECKHWDKGEILKYGYPTVKLCPVKHVPVIHLNFCSEWEGARE